MKFKSQIEKREELLKQVAELNKAIQKIQDEQLALFAEVLSSTEHTSVNPYTLKSESPLFFDLISEGLELDNQAQTILYQLILKSVELDYEVINTSEQHPGVFDRLGDQLEGSSFDIQANPESGYLEVVRNNTRSEVLKRIQDTDLNQDEQSLDTTTEVEESPLQSETEFNNQTPNVISTPIHDESEHSIQDQKHEENEPQPSSDEFTELLLENPLTAYVLPDTVTFQDLLPLSNLEQSIISFTHQEQQVAFVYNDFINDVVRSESKKIKKDSSFSRSLRSLLLEGVITTQSSEMQIFEVLKRLGAKDFTDLFTVQKQRGRLSIQPTQKLIAMLNFDMSPKEQVLAQAKLIEDYKI